MKNITLSLAAAILAVVFLAPPAHAQTATLRSTTLAAAVAQSDIEVTLTSGSGVEVGDLIFAEREAMQVTDISRSPIFPVRRGFAGAATPTLQASWFMPTTRPTSAPTIAPVLARRRRKWCCLWSTS
jgi:hypothetical protein